MFVLYTIIIQYGQPYSITCCRRVDKRMRWYIVTQYTIMFSLCNDLYTLLFVALFGGNYYNYTYWPNIGDNRRHYVCDCITD